MPAATPPRRTNKYDVELANAERKWAFLLRLADAVVWAATIAACSLPVWALRAVVQPLAGKETQADIKVNVTLAIAVTLSVVGNFFQYGKGAAQRRTIKRQRSQLDRLEERAGLPIVEERRRLAEQTD